MDKNIIWEPITPFIDEHIIIAEYLQKARFCISNCGVDGRLSDETCLGKCSIKYDSSLQTSRQVFFANLPKVLPELFKEED